MPRRAPRFRPPCPYRMPAGVESKAERDAFYSSAPWMRLRLVFLRANPVCERCLEAGKVEPATIAHHVEERLATPARSLDPTNLQALCGSCHSKIHGSRTYRPGPR
jgi:5-methylcytosine-specific restriction endonuclease McrA